jgi:hypothetical protein
MKHELKSEINFKMFVVLGILYKLPEGHSFWVRSMSGSLDVGERTVEQIDLWRGPLFILPYQGFRASKPGTVISGRYRYPWKGEPLSFTSLDFGKNEYRHGVKEIFP